MGGVSAFKKKNTIQYKTEQTRNLKARKDFTSKTAYEKKVVS